MTSPAIPIIRQALSELNYSIKTSGIQYEIEEVLPKPDDASSQYYIIIYSVQNGIRTIVSKVSSNYYEAAANQTLKSIIMYGITAMSNSLPKTS
jgi:hypothetical protein